VRLPPWQFWLSLGPALTLALLPLPPWLSAWNPDWVALVVIFWALNYPGRTGVGAAWCAGLLLDVMQGSLLGAHALAMTVVGYLTVKLYLRIRVFPLSQQALAVAMMLGTYHFVLFWVEGIVGGPAPGLDRGLAIVLGALTWVPLQAFLKSMWPRIVKD